MEQYGSSFPGKPGMRGYPEGLAQVPLAVRALASLHAACGQLTDPVSAKRTAPGGRKRCLF